MMTPTAAAVFEQLRKTVHEGSGVDFLAVCGDVARPADFQSKKDGVANRSWHKTGRAFDYDQNSKALVIVSEPDAGRQFFRTYLICADQSGKLGVKRQLRDYRGFTVNKYVFDFTAAAEAAGFKRIPAWSGWRDHYNRREFWHYQYNPQNLTWDAAMLELKGKTRPAEDAVIGLNDRGPAVTSLQTALADKGYLDSAEIDGVFGAKTKLAVMDLQKASGLDADGLVGPDTRKKLEL